MKDKNGKQLQIGNRIRNKGGMEAVIENIQGVTRLCVYDTRGKIVQTLKASDVNLENFERVDEVTE